ncbi:MAG: Mur ligase family protein [Minisyncoccales bacterium]
MKKIIKKIIPETFINWYHFCETFLGAFLYGFPGYSENVKIIGITGTNGKSTTVYLLSQILEEAGFKVAYFSSVKSKIRKEEKTNMLKMTMPGRFTLQRFIRKSIEKECDYIVLEVTSEGIKQFRHSFIDFKGAIFTNLTPEHIESHGSFKKYRENHYIENKKFGGKP